MDSSARILKHPNLIYKMVDERFTRSSWQRATAPFLVQLVFSRPLPQGAYLYGILCIGVRIFMNVHFILGAVVVVAVIALCWVLHRWYMRIGRRCRKCGKLKMRRIYKILRLRGEVVSWRNSEGRLRWWIRDVVKLTFVACGNCGVELEKIDRSAISAWHAQKVRWFQPEQYMIEEQTLFSIERSMPKFLGREWKSPDLKVQPSDAPPLSLNAVF